MELDKTRHLVFAEPVLTMVLLMLMLLVVQMMMVVMLVLVLVRVRVRALLKLRLQVTRVDLVQHVAVLKNKKSFHFQYRSHFIILLFQRILFLLLKLTYNHFHIVL
jgi:hypothetical protein